jgi:multidrug efflux pump subunit AcrA (membrane-fusion protein)
MKKKKMRRGVKALIFALFVIAALIGWNYLQPIVMTSAAPVYESFAVEAGSVAKAMCFSASLSLSNSEMVTAGGKTSVKQIFIEKAQPVSEGDRLLQLATGETLSAGIDGMINDIFVSVGDNVNPGALLVHIVDIDDMKVSIQVDEYDIDKVSVGQSCTVTVIALNRSFDTAISHINRVSSSTGNVARYTATAEVTVPEGVLPGMQASAAIHSAEASGVPMLDVSALSFDKYKNPYVLIKNADGGYDRIDIEVGLSDGLRVEVVSGLSAGDVVYAIAGTESAEPLFTFASLYMAAFGDTVVINDMSGTGGLMRGDMPFVEMPEGVEFINMSVPPEGITGANRQMPSGDLPGDFHGGGKGDRN